MNTKQKTELTTAQAEEIGRMCRDAADTNVLVCCFAASLAGESYPFTKAQCEIVFRGKTDEQIGRQFAEWADGAEDAW